MDFRVEQIPQRRVAFLRHVGPYIECGATWQRLMQTPQVQETRRPDTICLGICYDDPQVTPAAECRYDACVTVADDFVPTGDLQVQHIAGGNFAMTTHHGSYAGLGQAYGAVHGWIASSGKNLRPAPCFEVYVNDCNEVPEADLLTEIYLPID